MWFVEEDIRKILNELPSECSYLDYKVTPYPKGKKHDFIKDVIAMLNSPECIGMKKYIIFGVTDDKKLVGLNGVQPNDNEYQNWADNIVPRPQIQTGTISFKDKEFGYVYILETNEYVVHEVKNSVSGEEGYKSAGRNVVLQGQAFLRRGSRNEVMMQSDREYLSEHKSQGNSQILAPINLPPKCAVSNVTTLIGAWDESRIGDCKAIERIYGKEYSSFQIELRDFYAKNQDVVSFSNKVWKVNSRKQLIESIAAGVFDDQIDSIKAISCDVISSTDAFLDLAGSNKDVPTYQQLIETEKSYIYSDVFRMSLFEFWGYAGANADAFISLSKYKVQTCIREIIRKIIHSDNWKVLITNSKVLSILAEAFPDAFLNEVEAAIRDKDKGLYSALAGDGRFAYARDFAYSLSKAIGLLATYRDSFSKAGRCLVALCDMNKVFLDKISTIMLPWYPQTEAGAGVRKGLLKAAFMEHPDNAWKLLLTLLPHQTTNSYPVEKARYIMPAKISDEGVKTQDYWDEVLGLVSLACSQASENANRLTDLIPVMDDVPEKNRTEILSTIKDSFLHFSDSERYCIWMKLKDFDAKHRKFSDAEWAIPKEQLQPIDELISKLENDIWLPKERWIFRHEQWELIDYNGNYKENEEKLFQEQIVTAKRVFDLGVDSFIRFLELVDNPKSFGMCVAHLEISDEIWQRILRMLEQANSKNSAFATAFVQEAYRSDSSFINEYLTKIQPDKAIMLFELLPITAESLSVTRKVNEEIQKHYWKNVEAYGFKADDDETRNYVVDRLIGVGREKEALGILYYAIKFYKIKVSAEMVADALEKCPDIEAINDDYYVVEYLLSYVEESNMPEKQKVSLEWKFLDLMSYEHSFRVKAIYRQFENDATEFMRAFSMIHKGESDDEMPPFNSSIYRLLENWKVVPGTSADGSFDGAHFSEWIAKVMAIAEKTKRVDSVEHYLGKLLFHSPASVDGLFIDKSVAMRLNSDNRGHMLNGFLVEAINSRGVHSVDETGSAEFKLENDYRDKATAVEIEGFTRFADTLRMIARDYHDEALHNIEESRKWRDGES